MFVTLDAVLSALCAVIIFSEFVVINDVYSAVSTHFVSFIINELTDTVLAV